MRIHLRVCDPPQHLARQSNLRLLRQCPSEKWFLILDSQRDGVTSSRNVWAVGPIDVPLPPPSEVVYAM